jgi:hypothetical protein
LVALSIFGRRGEGHYVPELGDFIGNPEHSGAFTITVKTNDGTFIDNLPGGPGENFVTILAQGNETILPSPSRPLRALASFDQPRISGIASAAMMLIGFAGLGFALRQSRRKVSMA